MAHSSSPLDSSRVSDTNPDTIKALWTDVASVVSMSSRGQPIKNGRRGGAGGGRAGGGSRAGSDVGKEASPSASVPTSVFDPSESRHTPESTATHTTRTISPRHANFSKLVLHPRAITINDTNSIVPSAFAHFGTNEPPDGEVVDYTQLVALGGAAHNFWVVLDDDAVGDIAAEYREMRGLGLCEEEFATFAKTHFLRGELRSRNVSEDRQWRAERMLQLVCPPKENAHWRVPPVMVTSDSPRDVGEAPELWSWDIRPDCAYWLSLRGFNPRYRFQIQNCTFIRDWITCPYLSVEFKRDGESEDVAVRQVCAAGALALFNRCYLHLEARKAATPNKSLVGNNLVNTDKEEMASIRHYTLTFIGHKFVFWVLLPTWDGQGQWAGCVMKRLFGADCTDKYAVRELADWINEIHRWGLSQHGPSCERDIKRVLNIGGVRTSDVHHVS